MKIRLAAKAAPTPFRESISTLKQSVQWTDARLVERALEDDSFAEHALYRRYAPLLLNIAARILRRMSDADDVVQETFTAAFRKLHTLKNPEAFKPWLVRILMCEISKCFRIRRLKSFFGMDSADDDASLVRLAFHDIRPDLRVELAEIDSVLKKSRVKCTSAWMLHRVEGMSISETARAMGCSISGVKRYVSEVDKAVHARRGSE